MASNRMPLFFWLQLIPNRKQPSTFRIQLEREQVILLFVTCILILSEIRLTNLLYV